MKMMNMKKMMNMNMSKQGWLALSVIGIGGAMMLGNAWRKSLQTVLV